jgi:hypothetical protein
MTPELVAWRGDLLYDCCILPISRGAFMTVPAFQEHLAKIGADYRPGNARKFTHPSTLEYLLEALAPEVDVSSDPKHITCGAPDFFVARRKIPLGYVETKDVGEDLNRAEKPYQLKRCRTALYNLILTDYTQSVLCHLLFNFHFFSPVHLSVGGGNHLLQRVEEAALLC